jgi:hypothetical protein
VNTKIKQLAEQAWDSLIDEMGDVVSKDGRLNWDFLHAYDQRFAELIVRECADVGSKFSMAHPEAIRYQIKRHFGVDYDRKN